MSKKNNYTPQDLEQMSKEELQLFLDWAQEQLQEGVSYD